ncbi:hypothetical protein H5410_046763 [Solanum commersonii]|uniref:Uncharacterized protein n=1 Tax=Solanum commersonii TaxID=4109 RepID=A0A9J5XD59_SOLCO|nr:hypothetical protein H5410_046763 [Solanum commersonii]
MARTNEGRTNPSKKGSEGPHTTFFETENDHSLQSRQAKIRAKSRPDSARVPPVSTPVDSVPAPTPPVAPVPPIDPPPRLLNRLKADRLQTILEEKLLSIKGLEGRYSAVRHNLHFHWFEQFPRPLNSFMGPGVL